ncbi:MAG: phosphoribosylformylglycinamidine synthase subunit PurL [Oscillatoriales cyanobacterium SM2_2_1]|nr:phosphoribosylformylglycinamidine synthase subunit PurL [Oscillatoriales cyanobacterium SM2_2_1]
MTDISPALAAQIRAEGLTLEEYQGVCDRLQRQPNRAELGMFGVMWSEHCCYKNSRPLLKQFPTQGDRILVGPGENAGVVKITDRLAICFKIESHNRPSAVEPYQGATTGVGGILRDIFTMGARPVALLNALRFGDPHDPWVRSRIRGIVAGIGGYGNCVGVPTIGGETYFDPAYQRNPLVNAMAIGILETAEIVKSAAAGIGNPILYVGSTTGRDGIKGASFASAELSDHSEQRRPAVQVGDPFLGKCLIEACLEAFHTGAIVAAQDMGAAGLTCSTSEMAAKGGVGVLLDLDRVPAREPGMVPYEYLLSESQERMLFVLERGREAEVIPIFQRWGLHAVVVGEVISEPVVRILWRGAVAAEVPARALADDTPVYYRSLPETPDYAAAAWAWNESTLGDAPRSPQEIFLDLLTSPNIASKSWIYRQYDHQVQNNTVLLPDQGDAAVIRLRSPASAPSPDSPETWVGLAATVDCPARYVYLDPYRGAALAVAEAARNLSCVGSLPLAVTDNLNFGSPEQPVGYWQLHGACRGIAEACRQLNTPVTGGNVSLYNETIDSQGVSRPIYPTPVIGMVGLVEDVRRICGQGWQRVGDRLYLLGPLTASLAASEYLFVCHGQTTGRPLAVDWDLERAVQAACREGIAQGWVRSAHDCAEGGLAIALGESAIAGNLAATILLPAEDHLGNHLTVRQMLFGEAPSRITVAIAPEHQGEWEEYLRRKGVPYYQLGVVISAEQPFTLWIGETAVILLPLEELKQRYHNALAQALEPSSP